MDKSNELIQVDEFEIKEQLNRYGIRDVLAPTIGNHSILIIGLDW
jgi:hypothetical protein